MSDNFFKIKNGLNLPTVNADPAVTPPAANPTAGDMVFYSGKLYRYNGSAWVVTPGSGTTGLITNADVDNAADIVDTKFATISTAGKVSGTAITSGNINTTGNITTSGDISTTGTGNITAARILKSLGELQVISNAANPAVYIEQTHSTGPALVVADQADPDTTVTVIDSSGKVGIGVAANATLNEKLTVTGDVKVTTGDIRLDTAKGIESSVAASTLNVGTGTNTSAINIGTGSGVQSVNIGTGAGVTTITIGGAGDTVYIAGTLTWIQTTNLEVSDKRIALNKGSTTVAGNGAGVDVLGDSDAPIASVIYDNTLQSKWKVGTAASQAEVVTVSDSQTLSNKTVGTVIAESGTLSITGTGALKIPVGTSAEQPAGVQGMIRYDTTASAFQGYDGTTWSSIGGATTIKRITQASHGFSVGQVVYLNGSTYAPARADVAATAEVAGMVSRVIDASTFELTICGEVSGLSSLTPGENYFLSASSAGAITATEPTVVGQISLPVGIASSATTLLFKALRGTVVGGANVRTQIGLANNATTTIQNAGAYDAGELAGWVYIDATTDYRFYIQAQFAKRAASPTDYNLSYQTTGDTPPAGFSVSITAAGLIQVTLPNLAGFVAGGSFINFALNAPAVGATLPLQVDSANVNFTDIKAASAAGITFKEDGGTTVGSVSDAGAWRFGPSVTNNYTGRSHVISGGFTAGNVTSTNASGRLYLTSNCNVFDHAATSRTNTVTAGAGISLDNGTANGNSAFAVYTNLTGDALTADANTVGYATYDGAWVLGPSGFTGTHTINARKIVIGSSIIRQGGGGTVNNAATFTSTIPLNTDGGGGLVVISGYTTSTGAAFTWIGWAAIQVAGGSGTVASAAIAGTSTAWWSLGSSGGFLTATNNSGIQLTIVGITLVGC